MAGLRPSNLKSAEPIGRRPELFKFTAWAQSFAAVRDCKAQPPKAESSWHRRTFRAGPDGNGFDYRVARPLNWFRELGVNLAAAETFLQEHSATGATMLLLGRDRELLGALALRDALKPRALRDVVAQSLPRRGLTIRLVTGDQRCHQPPRLRRSRAGMLADHRVSARSAAGTKRRI